MSRVELIWEHIQTISQHQNRVAIRQQSLAEHFGCSRRTIGRALKALKESGRLQDTGMRENRIKLYRLPCSPPQAVEGKYTWIEFEKATFTPPSLRVGPGECLNPHAEQQWRLYHRTLKINLDCYDGQSGRPLLEHVYAGLTATLTGKNEDELFSNVFALLRAAPYYKACEDSHYQERVAAREASTAVFPKTFRHQKTKSPVALPAGSVSVPA